jgi:hypothetical protein
MSYMEVATRMGVGLYDVELLLEGNVPVGVANRLGVPMVALRDFIKLGVANASIAHRIGTSMAAAEDLAQSVGSEGRVGIVVGLLLSMNGERSKAVGT